MKRDFIPLCEPFIGEEEKEAVARVLDSKWLSQGEWVKEFEGECARYFQVKNAIAVSSGTAALHLCLLAEHIRSGEVIVPDFTVCTANPVVHSGAVPLFVDVDPQTYTLEFQQINDLYALFSSKALIPVHLFGQAVDLDMLDRDKNYGAVIIEDCAQAFGTEYHGKKVGTLGDYGCFSFDGRKIISIGEGGLIITNNDEKAAWLRLARSHGQLIRLLSPNGIPEVTFPIAGLNYRMTDYQAAIGLAQLKKVDFMIIRRRQIAALYNDLLCTSSTVQPPIELPCSCHSYMAYVIKLTDKAGINSYEFMVELKKHNVQTSYGSRALHLESDFQKYPILRKPNYNSTILQQRTVALPIFPAMTDDEVHYVCSCIKKVEE